MKVAPGRPGRRRCGCGRWSSGRDRRRPKCAECRRRGLHVNVQTSGLRRVNAPWDWCTVSPKGPVAALEMDFAQELKIVYTGQSIEELKAYYEGFSAWNYYLQPCWRAGGSNQAATLEMVYALNRVGLHFEFSAQWHKFLGVK